MCLLKINKLLSIHESFVHFLIEELLINCVASLSKTNPYLFAQYVTGFLQILFLHYCVIFYMQLTSYISTMQEGSVLRF